MTDAPRIVVVAAEPALAPRARQTAEQLGLALSTDPALAADIFLVVEEDRYFLQASAENPAQISIDFTAGKALHRRKFGGGINQPLAKALGLQKKSVTTVLDATGGLARDAFVLASLGAELTIVEQSPVLCLLIQAAIEKALDDEEVAPIVHRMKIMQGDSVAFLRTIDRAEKPDAVYLDPMYPPRQKTAAVKKEMQLLHKLIGPEGDSTQLLEAALDSAKKRVVVKRPLKAAPLSQSALAGSVKSANTRYDIYTPRQP
ncbi:MAG: class I SAM-dependent methyltransferase [Gammaproteobacteria bacterium]|nr:class I SAM-dependent methyltransferase [Gammaproteobacteria bacterium]